MRNTACSPTGLRTNDLFVNILDVGTEWEVSASAETVYEGRGSATGKVKWSATRRPRVGLQPPARATAEVYTCEGSKETFVSDFVAA